MHNLGYDIRCLELGWQSIHNGHIHTPQQDPTRRSVMHKEEKYSRNRSTVFWKDWQISRFYLLNLHKDSQQQLCLTSRVRNLKPHPLQKLVTDCSRNWPRNTITNQFLQCCAITLMSHLMTRYYKVLFGIVPVKRSNGRVICNLTISETCHWKGF